MDEEIILTEADLEEILSVAAWGEGEPRGLDGPREGRTGALCAHDAEIILTEADLEEVLAVELGEDALLLTEADLEQVLSCGEDAELLEQWFEAGERLADDNPDGIDGVDLHDDRADRPDLIGHWLESLFDPTLRPRRLQEA